MARWGSARSAAPRAPGPNAPRPRGRAAVAPGREGRRGPRGRGGGQRARRAPYQVQHSLHDVPVADLADLYESDQHCEFHPDVADRHRRVDHTRGQHHRAGAAAGARAGRPPRLSHPAAPASGPDSEEPRGLRLEPRARARLLARHAPPS